MNLMSFPYNVMLLNNGGGGDAIVTLVVLSFIGFFVWLIVRYFMRQAKKEIVKNHLQKFSRTDPFWDERKMKQTVQLVYSNAHIAWARKSSYYIAGLASEELVKEWENI